MPDGDGLRMRIPEDSHWSKLYIHLGGNKKYQDMRRLYLWPKIKKEVGKFEDICVAYPRFKVEY